MEVFNIRSIEVKHNQNMLNQFYHEFNLLKKKEIKEYSEKMVIASNDFGYIFKNITEIKFITNMEVYGIILPIIYYNRIVTASVGSICANNVKLLPNINTPVNFSSIEEILKNN